MTNSAAVSTPSRIVSTETAFQRASSLVHLVTQWMSLVTSSAGSARNSSQVHFLGSSISPSTTNVHSGKPTRGVGPAERTGKSFTTYCPGGTRELLADLIVSPEHDGFRLGRNVGAADRPALADDPHLRDVFRLIHADQISTGRALWRYAR